VNRDTLRAVRQSMGEGADAIAVSSVFPTAGQRPDAQDRGRAPAVTA